MIMSSSHNSRWRTAVIALATVALAAALLFLAGCSGSGDPKQLYESKCGTCHSLETVNNAAYTGEEQWKGVVDRMKAMTTTISDDEAKQITEYLASR